MAEPAPISETRWDISRMQQCIDWSLNVDRFAALVRMVGSNLELLEILYIAQDAFLSAPAGEKRDKRGEMLKLTVARYERLKEKDKIPERKLARFLITRLKFFAKTGDEFECARLLSAADDLDAMDRGDMWTAERIARKNGHVKVADVIAAALEKGARA